jgi:hypothetical protein
MLYMFLSDSLESRHTTSHPSPPTTARLRSDSRPTVVSYNMEMQVCKRSWIFDVGYMDPQINQVNVRDERMETLDNIFLFLDNVLWLVYANQANTRINKSIKKRKKKEKTL